MPWEVALRAEAALPSGVLGPVERVALARLAASWVSEIGTWMGSLNGKARHGGRAVGESSLPLISW